MSCVLKYFIIGYRILECSCLIGEIISGTSTGILDPYMKSKTKQKEHYNINNQTSYPHNALLSCLTANCQLRTCTWDLSC